MAVIAFGLGSILGMILALFAWLLLGFGIGPAFTLYISTAIMTGALIIVACFWTPPRPLQIA